MRNKAKLRIEHCPNECPSHPKWHYRLIWTGNVIPLTIGTFQECWMWINRNHEYVKWSSAK